MADAAKDDAPRVIHVDLAQDVTHDLFTGPYRRVFRFLSKRGDFMREGGDGDPVTVDRWTKAVDVARQIGAAFIVCYDKKRVLARIESARGGSSWLPAVVFPHASVKHATDQVRERMTPMNQDDRPPHNRSGASRRRFNKENAQ